MPKKKKIANTKKSSRTSFLPLTGIKVLDASRVLAGPYCGQILGGLGAEVIKLENPIVGDETRTWGPPFVNGQSAYFLSCNQSKQSITLDLQNKKDRTTLTELLPNFDIVIENFRKSSLLSLGFLPKQLWKHNPDLIICSISGFGRTSSLQDVPGYDLMIQALSGLMSITGPENSEGFKVGVAVSDVLTGLYAANAIQAALVQQKINIPKHKKKGTHIGMALMDCAVSAQVNLLQAFLSTKTLPPRQGNKHLQIVPYQLFCTKDSSLVLAVGNDAQWKRFCKIAACSELLDSPLFQKNSDRVKNRDLLCPKLDKLFASKTTAEWIEDLKDSKIPHAPVQNYEQLAAMPLAAERHWWSKDMLLSLPFHFDGKHLAAQNPPPYLGNANTKILKKI